MLNERNSGKLPKDITNKKSTKGSLNPILSKWLDQPRKLDKAKRKASALRSLQNKSKLRAEGYDSSLVLESKYTIGKKGDTYELRKHIGGSDDNHYVVSRHKDINVIKGKMAKKTAPKKAPAVSEEVDSIDYNTFLKSLDQDQFVEYLDSLTEEEFDWLENYLSEEVNLNDSYTIEPFSEGNNSRSTKKLTTRSDKSYNKLIDKDAPGGSRSQRRTLTKIGDRAERYSRDLNRKTNIGEEVEQVDETHYGQKNVSRMKINHANTDKINRKLDRWNPADKKSSHNKRVYRSAARSIDRDFANNSKGTIEKFKRTKRELNSNHNIHKISEDLEQVDETHSRNPEYHRSRLSKKAFNKLVKRHGDRNEKRNPGDPHARDYYHEKDFLASRSQRRTDSKLFKKSDRYARSIYSGPANLKKESVDRVDETHYGRKNVSTNDKLRSLNSKLNRNIDKRNKGGYSTERGSRGKYRRLGNKIVNINKAYRKIHRDSKAMEQDD